MVVKRSQEEYNAILKQVQEQPGIEELLQVYGRCSEVLYESREYLAGVKSTVVITADFKSA